MVLKIYLFIGLYKPCNNPTINVNTLDEVFTGCTKYINYDRNYNISIKLHTAIVNIPKGVKNNQSFAYWKEKAIKRYFS